MCFLFTANHATMESFLKRGDPELFDEHTGYKGNNRPIRAFVIGSKFQTFGKVVHVKILGSLSLISKGKTNWKLIWETSMACVPLQECCSRWYPLDIHRVIIGVHLKQTIGWHHQVSKKFWFEFNVGDPMMPQRLRLNLTLLEWKSRKRYCQLFLSKLTDSNAS